MRSVQNSNPHITLFTSTRVEFSPTVSGVDGYGEALNMDPTDGADALVEKKNVMMNKVLAAMFSNVYRLSISCANFFH